MITIEEAKKTLNTVGFVGERKALALAGLGFYAVMFTLIAILFRAQPPEVDVAKFAPVFFGLGACYGFGFFALAADWFWARWFAMGLGSSGVSLVVWTVFISRQLPSTLLIFGLVHLGILVFLAGDRVAERYDGREDWRKRFQLDEQAVLRLKRSVTRAATSLPTLIVLALQPREDEAELVAFIAIATLATGGVYGLLRNRVWGVLALGAAAASVVTAGFFSHDTFRLTFLDGPALAVPHLSLLAGVLLAAAFAPFVRPLRAFLHARG